MNEYGLPSPSGARIAGDDYQHLFTWLQALKLRREVEGVTHIEIEVGGGHNVDDVVVHRQNGPALYYQVKFVTAQREPLSHDWFTDPGDAQRSPLQRFYDSFVKLTEDGGRPEMVLETNRWPVDGDPILICVDGQSHKLVPRLPLAAAGSASGRVRREWAEHLGISEGELYEMFEHLEIRAGRSSFEELREHCCWLMGAVGLLDDVDAVDVGMGEIRRLVRQGVRHLDAAALAEIIAEKRLERGQSRATLLVQQLDRDALPELATASVDWVALFEGDEPAARRQLHDPSGWNDVLRPQLREAVAEIKEQGHRDVAVAGALRLSTAMATGIEMSDVAGFTVAVRQRDREWSSSGDRVEAALDRVVLEVAQGDQLAVGISVAVDIGADVVAYLQREKIPVRMFVNLLPASGVGRDAIGGPEEARGLAQALLDAIRGEVRGYALPLHLFAAGPLGLSLLLGHVWNRMPETQLYDDLGADRGYAPTFHLAG
jgi:hypothetical protein